MVYSDRLDGKAQKVKLEEQMALLQKHMEKIAYKIELYEEAVKRLSLINVWLKKKNVFSAHRLKSPDLLFDEALINQNTCKTADKHDRNRVHVQPPEQNNCRAADGNGRPIGSVADILQRIGAEP